MITINPVRALKDNYIWIITNQNNRSCAIVDPSDAKPVLAYLKAQRLKPCAILTTHHHWDHTNGIAGLLEHGNIPVYGPSKENIPLLTHPLQDNDCIELTELSIKFQALETPGHTTGQIAYYGNGVVFTGDTLFSAGCGRMFEGTPEQFVHSLIRLRKLPDETKVYCGHEYTLNNMKFALTVEPKNNFILNHMKTCKALIDQGSATLPSTIKIEKQINSFFRFDQVDVIRAAEKYAGKSLHTPEDVFATIRKWKDQF